MVKDYKDYAMRLHAEYPHIPEKVIQEILRKGISRMQDLIHRDMDIHLKSCTGSNQYDLFMVRPIVDKFDRWQRALSRLRKLVKLREKYGTTSK